ncbi:MAG: hypothetical protein WBW04_14325 [Nitrolancea sp.]
MRRSIITALLAVLGIILVVVLVSSHVPIPKRTLQQRTSLANTTATETPSPTALSSPTSKVDTSPMASPTQVITSTVTATEAASASPTSTPSPSPTLSAAPTSTPEVTPKMVTESNGISMGCDPGSAYDYLTCEANEPSGFSMTFYLFLPRNFSPKTSYPLVLLLAGGGERAVPTKTAQQNRDTILNDPYSEIWGPGFPEPYSEDVQARWPSFIVIPQLQVPNRFVDVPANYGTYSMTPQPNDSLRLSKEIVDTLQLVYSNIDANRIYLTGLSMGGYGTWDAAERWPNYWAALAPIAGAGDPTYANLLVNVPIWDFHSSDDTTVPVSGSRDMINAIRAAGGDPRYTEFTNMGHGAWLAPYTIMGKPSPTPGFFSWLFAQHK